MPAVVDLSSQTIMWTIEAILVGRLSAAAFAGVAMAIQIVVVFFAVLLTFVVGSSVIIARALGRNDQWEANHILGQTVLLGVVMAFAFAVIWYSGAIHLFKLIGKAGAEEAGLAAERAGVTYLRTVSFFAPLIVTNFIGVGIIRGSGDTRHSMVINMVVNGLNLVLAPSLIFGWFGLPRLEVRGAALAVGVAHSVGFFLTFGLLLSPHGRLRLPLRELLRPNEETFRRLLRTGVPTTVEQLATSVGVLFMMSYAARLGLATLSAHAVFVRVQAVLSMAYMGFGLGAMTLVGMDLGAGDQARALRTARLSMRVTFAFVIAVAVLLVLFSNQIMALFLTGRETAVLAKGAAAVYVFALAQIPKALLGSVAGSLRGAGDLRFLMWLTIVSVLIFEIGLNYAAAFVLGWGLVGLWAVHGTGEVTRLTVTYHRLHGNRGQVAHRV
ncbi:MAG: MATE family efflux transporter [bacterium]|nr:MATE family efflux transporter [candidate division KSB1 bacterium]MDH7558995.1 MATE family efflux transporter [bacterium]